MEIKISEVFTKTPGARFKTDGDFSGEEFRQSFLLPSFEQAEQRNEKLTIDLDDGYGYATSFLEESFGGLARIHGTEKVLKTLAFISQDEPSLIAQIEQYIQNSNNKKTVGAS